MRQETGAEGAVRAEVAGGDQVGSSRLPFGKQPEVLVRRHRSGVDGPSAFQTGQMRNRFFDATWPSLIVAALGALLLYGAFELLLAREFPTGGIGAWALWAVAAVFLGLGYLGLEACGEFGRELFARFRHGTSAGERWKHRTVGLVLALMALAIGLVGLWIAARLLNIDAA